MAFHFFGLLDFKDMDIAREKDKLDEAISKGMGFLEWREVLASPLGYRAEFIYYYVWDGKGDLF